MIFCGMALAPGRKVRVPLPVPGAQPLETLCLCGAAPGRTLVVTAGVHGCEYVGVQALRCLAVELDPAELSGNVILLPLANPTGFYAGAKQVVPEDGVNLNRAFPGDPAGTLSARLAYALETALYQAADFLADLHSGDGGGEPGRPDGRPGADSALPGPLHRPKRPLQLGRAEKHSRAAH